MKNKKLLTVLFLMILSILLGSTTLNHYIAQANASGEKSEPQSLSLVLEEENLPGSALTDDALMQSQQQWNHQAINIATAWSEGYTGLGVNVAILDTGFFADHPEITFAGGASIYPDDPWTNDHTGHGTHIAGIIGAHFGTEFQGIAPDVNLYGIKIYHRDHIDENGAAYTDIQSIAQGIDLALQHQAHIIVISSSVPSDDPVLYAAIQRAASSGALVISASGNGADQVQYPAAYEEVIAVSSIDRHYQPAADLTSGPETDLVAPGVDIGGLSTPDSIYGYPHLYMSGSSQAAPHVAGLAAILMQKHHFNPSAVREDILSHALNLGDPLIYGNGLAYYQS